MARTYTQDATQIQEAQQLTVRTRGQLDSAVAQLSSVVATLAQMTTTYGPAVTDIDTQSAANPSDAGWQALKATSDHLVADFGALKAQAQAIVTAVNGVTG